MPPAPPPPLPPPPSELPPGVAVHLVCAVGCVVPQPASASASSAVHKMARIASIAATAASIAAGPVHLGVLRCGSSRRGCRAGGQPRDAGHRHHGNANCPDHATPPSRMMCRPHRRVAATRIPVITNWWLMATPQPSLPRRGRVAPVHHGLCSLMLQHPQWRAVPIASRDRA